LSILFVCYFRNTAQKRRDVPRGPFLMAGPAFLVAIPVDLSTRSRMTQPPPVPADP